MSRVSFAAMKFISIAGVFAALAAQAQDCVPPSQNLQGMTPPVHSEVLKAILKTDFPAKKHLEALWLAHPESALEKVALFTPRLLSDAVHYTLESRTLQRVENLGWAAYHLIDSDEKDGSKRAEYRLANSPLNLAGTLHEVISDAATAITLPRMATGRTSQRIQLCTNHLEQARNKDPSWADIEDPRVHVAVVFDGFRETADPRSEGNSVGRSIIKQGGAICSPVPIYSGESDSLAIERMACLSDAYHYKAPYEFFGYNCGGFSEDILEWSGAGFSSLPNAGVGNRLTLAATDETLEKRQRMKSVVIHQCEVHVKSLQDTLFTLEAGAGLTPNQKDHLVNLAPKLPTRDLFLQLLISAARSKNPGNREFLKSLWSRREDHDYYVYSTPVEKAAGISGELRSQLAEMFQSLDSESLEWITGIDEGYRELIQTLRSR